MHYQFGHRIISGSWVTLNVLYAWQLGSFDSFRVTPLKNHIIFYFIAK